MCITINEGEFTGEEVLDRSKRRLGQPISSRWSTVAVLGGQQQRGAVRGSRAPRVGDQGAGALSGNRRSPVITRPQSNWRVTAPAPARNGGKRHSPGVFAAHRRSRFSAFALVLRGPWWTTGARGRREKRPWGGSDHGAKRACS